MPDRGFAEHARLLSEALSKGSGFGHLTSARLRKWWLPNQLGQHVLFVTTAGSLHVQRDGLYVRRSRYAEVEMLGEIPVMSMAVTLIEPARDLSLVDLVPMVDQAIAAGCPAGSILAAAHPRIPGAQRLRRAVALADPRSESW